MLFTGYGVESSTRGSKFAELRDLQESMKLVADHNPSSFVIISDNLNIVNFMNNVNNDILWENFSLACMCRHKLSTLPICTKWISRREM